MEDVDFKRGRDDSVDEEDDKDATLANKNFKPTF